MKINFLGQEILHMCVNFRIPFWIFPILGNVVFKQKESIKYILNMPGIHAWLAWQAGTELGTAEPQLVSRYHHQSPYPMGDTNNYVSY